MNWFCNPCICCKNQVSAKPSCNDIYFLKTLQFALVDLLISLKRQQGMSLLNDFEIWVFDDFSFTDEWFSKTPGIFATYRSVNDSSYGKSVSLITNLFNDNPKISSIAFLLTAIIYQVSHFTTSSSICCIPLFMY